MFTTRFLTSHFIAGKTFQNTVGADGAISRTFEESIFDLVWLRTFQQQCYVFFQLQLRLG